MIKIESLSVVLPSQLWIFRRQGSGFLPCEHGVKIGGQTGNLLYYCYSIFCGVNAQLQHPPPRPLLSILQRRERRLIVSWHMIFELLLGLNHGSLYLYNIITMLSQNGARVTAFRCYCIMILNGYILMACFWLQFFTSIDRFLCILFPIQYNNVSKYMVRVTIACLLVQLIILIIALPLDQFCETPLLFCNLRVSIPKFTLNLNLRILAFLSIMPVLLYSTTFAMVKIRLCQLRADVTSIAQCRILQDGVTGVLLLLSVLHLLTSCSESISVVLSISNVPSYGISYHNSFLMMNGVIYFVCQCCFVQSFRTGLKCLFSCCRATTMTIVNQFT
uniref:G-protein coupled receptors family 1 profile domain-containing protein n=1 Tax=Romanomermis culicivorax TaxID=13658 RepID=A0A915HGA5_ROMCU